MITNLLGLLFHLLGLLLLWLLVLGTLFVLPIWLLASGIALLVNFTGNKLFVFKKRAEEPTEEPTETTEE